MLTVVVSPVNVANFPDGGGHHWVYLQYVLGLRALGCEVFWLERFHPTGDAGRDRALLRTFARSMRRFGLAHRVLLYTVGHDPEGPPVFLDRSARAAAAVLSRADLLLNFDYRIGRDLLSCFARTALVDIDPGLLQTWISAGQLAVAPHDRYFTTGETVGSPAAGFPSCGLPWVHIRPPICLDEWPPVDDHPLGAFTTVSSWWGDEWMSDQDGVYENNKRVTFLQFVPLPQLTDQPLELALYLGDGDTADREVLERHGWRVRHSREVAASAGDYRAYIQRSLGEFSCVKPSCLRFRNAWISDRTIAFLASGKPAVVQDTGPSAFLPDGDGLLRFRTLGEAAQALSAVAADYRRHARAAREIAESCFDARPILEGLLNAVHAPVHG